MLRPPVHPQEPETQCVLFVHARLHAPQFESSLWMDAQALLQTISSGPHIEAHLPFEQSHPLSHAEPHAPQFAESACRLAHVPPQFVVPCGQAHLPLAHVADMTQAAPHEPQLLVSVRVSTQAPAQNVRLGEEQESSHTPLTQDAPAGHMWPQVPQFPGSLCTSPQDELDPLPLLPPRMVLHAEAAIRIAKEHPIVESSANRTKLLDVSITSVLGEQGGCPRLPMWRAFPTPGGLVVVPGPWTSNGTAPERPRALRA